MRTVRRRKASVDHRTRVGQARRARTQARIIAAALRVFTEHGPQDPPVIDDFIRAAGVARGTFYNYYKSVGELLEATRKWLEDDFIESIEGEVASLDDPIERLTTGMRLWIRKAESDPLWCSFAAHAGELGGLAKERLSGDLRNGQRAGQLNYPSFDAAYDLVVGSVREGMRRILSQRVRRKYDLEIVQIILQGLGLGREAIARALARPLPVMRRTRQRIS